MKFIPNVKIVAALVAGLLVGLNGSVGAITIAHNGDSVDIEFVDIGNIGNVADTAVDGYGAVNYEYSIGKFEVTADQWAAVSGFDNLVENSANDPWTGSQPTTNTSWYEAAKFTNWLTSGDALQGAYTFSDTNTFTGVDRAAALTTYGTIYVLPSEDEWYKAAYFKSDGSDYTTFATGSSAPDGIDFSGDTNYDSAFADSFLSTDSPYVVGGGTVENNGTYDMNGNVWELLESSATGGSPIGGESRAIRGGGYGTLMGFLTSSHRSSGDPRVDNNDSYGFRVASVTAVPEPTSTALLALGGLAVMLRRRRLR